MRQDGTYSIQEIDELEFIKTLGWAINTGIVENHIHPRSIIKVELVVDKSVRHICDLTKLPKYKSRYTLENGELLLIAENGKFFNGTYINQCPNQ